MPKVELDVETSASPEAVRAALLDFSDRRPEIWPGIDPSLYEVYTVGDSFADVQEGSKMPRASIWAKEHYDWSTSGLVTWTVQESTSALRAATFQPRSRPEGTAVAVST